MIRLKKYAKKQPNFAEEIKNSDAKKTVGNDLEKLVNGMAAENNNGFSCENFPADANIAGNSEHEDNN